VLEALAPAYPPNVIFITGHDEFARLAFDVNAVDYLLKPVERERFHLAIERALRKVQSETESSLEALTRYVRSARTERPHRLLVREGRNWSYVPVAQIDWIQAAGNYVEIHIGGRTHLYRERLSDLETRLDPNQFARVQRSVIVNLERIAAFTPTAYGDYGIVMHDGTRLRLSRRFRDRIPSLAGAL
jgi:two-component system LytT family response regulator